MKKLFIIAAIIGAAFVSTAQNTNAPAQTVPAQFQPLIAILGEIPVVPYTNETFSVSIGAIAGAGVANTIGADFLPSWGHGVLAYAALANNGSQVASAGAGIGYAVSGEYWQVSGRIGVRENYAVGGLQIRGGIEADYQQLYAGVYWVGDRKAPSVDNQSTAEFEGGVKFAF